MVDRSIDDVLVVLSGGQDSTTCLYWAKREYPEARLHAVTFDYGQRHEAEIVAAHKIAAVAGVVAHHFVNLGKVLVSSSPLVSDSELGQYSNIKELPGGVEPTFVPGRNLLFLTIAANRALALNCPVMVTGVCEEDFGGYPDCRRRFIDSLEVTLSWAMAPIEKYVRPLISIATPLMNLNKKDTVRLAQELPGCYNALESTHTCYKGVYPPCGRCHACMIRARGFKQAEVGDPLIMKAIAERRLPPDYPEHGLLDDQHQNTD